MVDEIKYRRLRMIKDMMANPLFNEAMNNIMVQMAAEVFVTNPEEADKRENLYYEQRALGRIIGRMQAMANEATHVEGQAQPKGAA